jgi:hypothetical protein
VHPFNSIVAVEGSPAFGLSLSLVRTQFWRGLQTIYTTLNTSLLGLQVSQINLGLVVSLYWSAFDTLTLAFSLDPCGRHEFIWLIYHDSHDRYQFMHG